MHFVKVIQPQYSQSQRYAGLIGEVVGRWGPENSASARDGYLVEFSNGEIVGLTEEEIEASDGPLSRFA